MVKNIVKIYKKITFLFKNNNFCIMNKIKPVWFYSLYRWIYSLYRNYFFELSPTCAEYVLLFSEFHDVKIETSMGCKELFDK